MAMPFIQIWLRLYNEWLWYFGVFRNLTMNLFGMGFFMVKMMASICSICGYGGIKGIYRYWFVKQSWLENMINFYISQLLNWVNYLVLGEVLRHWVDKIIKRICLELRHFIKHLPNVERKFFFVTSTVVNERKAWILRLLSRNNLMIHRVLSNIDFHLIVANDYIESLGCIS